MHWYVFCVLCVSICASLASHTHAQVLQLGGGPANVSNISRMHVLAPVADMVLGSCVFTTVLTTVLTCLCACRRHGTWCLWFTWCLYRAIKVGDEREGRSSSRRPREGAAVGSVVDRRGGRWVWAHSNR